MVNKSNQMKHPQTIFYDHLHEFVSATSTTKAKKASICHIAQRTVPTRRFRLFRPFLRGGFAEKAERQHQAASLFRGGSRARVRTRKRMGGIEPEDASVRRAFPRKRRRRAVAHGRSFERCSKLKHALVHPPCGGAVSSGLQHLLRGPWVALHPSRSCCRPASPRAPSHMLGRAGPRVFRPGTRPGIGTSSVRCDDLWHCCSRTPAKCRGGLDAGSAASSADG